MPQSDWAPSFWELRQGRVPRGYRRPKWCGFAKNHVRTNSIPSRSHELDEMAALANQFVQTGDLAIEEVGDVTLLLEGREIDDVVRDCGLRHTLLAGNALHRSGAFAEETMRMNDVEQEALMDRGAWPKHVKLRGAAADSVVEATRHDRPGCFECGGDLRYEDIAFPESRVSRFKLSPRSSRRCVNRVWPDCLQRQERHRLILAVGSVTRESAG